MPPREAELAPPARVVFRAVLGPDATQGAAAPPRDMMEVAARELGMSVDMLKAKLRDGTASITHGSKPGTSGYGDKFRLLARFLPPGALGNGLRAFAVAELLSGVGILLRALTHVPGTAAARTDEIQWLIAVEANQLHGFVGAAMVLAALTTIKAPRYAVFVQGLLAVLVAAVIPALDILK